MPATSSSTLFANRVFSSSSTSYDVDTASFGTFTRPCPEESANKSVDLTFARDGRFNAVVFWYTLNLIDDISITTAPPGKGGTENDHSTDVEPTTTSPRVCISIHPKCESCSDIGSSADYQ